MALRGYWLDLPLTWERLEDAEGICWGQLPMRMGRLGGQRVVSELGCLVLWGPCCGMLLTFMGWGEG